MATWHMATCPLNTPLLFSPSVPGEALNLPAVTQLWKKTGGAKKAAFHGG